MKYKVIDHTADTGIEIEASSLEELFQTAGEAFCELICDRRTIRPKIKRKITVGAQRTLHELLHGFLNELLFLFDSEHLLFSDLKINLSPPSPPPIEGGGTNSFPSPLRGEGRGEGEIKLTSKLMGEKIDPKKHKIKMGIKAVTHHQLKVWQDGTKWRARVIFDV